MDHQISFRPKFSFNFSMRGAISTAILAMSLLSGCAHLKSAGNSEADSAKPRTVSEVIAQDFKAHQEPSGAGPIVNGHELTINGVKLKNTQFDIPVVVNSRVEFWVDYFTGRGRPFFEKSLERSEFFIPYITPILKQNQMPEDLVYLSMIESGFNNLVRSRAKAVGPWQFISATGKRYGLMVNWWMDERRDIRKSTLAAVEYLRDLYSMFGSWELAAASYNAGEGKIARGVQRYGTKDFWVLSKHRFLRAETRDYVPKIIAAALIAKNRAQFGFQESNLKPAADEAVAGDGEIVKVIKTDKPLEDSSSANDSKLTQASLNYSEESDEDFDESDTGPGITPATMTVPLQTKQPEPVQANNNEPALPLAKPVPTPHVSKSGQVGGEQLAEFEVQSPADLLKVARAAGLSYQTVKSLNPELLRWCTPPNVGTYRLKLPTSTRDKFLVTYNHEAYPKQVEFMPYKVKSGETLAHIAKQFGIKVDPISDLNGLSARLPLRKGVRVLLPIPNDRTRSLAALDVRDPPESRRRSRRSGRHRRSRRYYKITYKKRESARSRNANRDDT